MAYDSAILRTVYDGIASNASVWNGAGVTLRMRDGPLPSSVLFAVGDVEIEAVFVGDI